MLIYYLIYCLMHNSHLSTFFLLLLSVYVCLYWHMHWLCVELCTGVFSRIYKDFLKARGRWCLWRWLNMICVSTQKMYSCVFLINTESWPRVCDNNTRIFVFRVHHSVGVSEHTLSRSERVCHQSVMFWWHYMTLHVERSFQSYSCCQYVMH